MLCCHTTATATRARECQPLKWLANESTVACAHERDEMLATLIDRGVHFEKATIKDVPESMHFHPSHHYLSFLGNLDWSLISPWFLSCPAITLFEWRGPLGSTPLMVAAQRGSVKCLKLLLRAGARLDTRDSKVGIFRYSPLQERFIQPEWIIPIFGEIGSNCNRLCRR
jgi:ankyrin repeat protein